MLTRIDADAVTGGIQDFATANGSDAIAVDYSGRFVYVANLLVDTIAAFSIDPATGALIRIDADAATAGSQDLALSAGRIVSLTVHPAQGYVYLATACGTVWAYTIYDTSGALTRIDSNPGGLCFAYFGSPNSIAVDPSGRFVYAAVYNTGDSISANSIDAATGSITQVTGGPFLVGPQTWSVVTSGVIE